MLVRDSESIRNGAEEQGCFTTNSRGVHSGLSGGSGSNSTTLVRPSLGNCYSCHLASLRPVSLAFPFEKLLKNM